MDRTDQNVIYLLERIDDKLDSIGERLASVEGAIQRHDERTLSHHGRLVVLEGNQRKYTWAIVSAGIAVLVALVPAILALL